MKGFIQAPITPQQKMIAVNNKFGNKNIAQQQGSSRVLFDSIPLDGRTNFRFFEAANTRQFPLTNIGSDGNKLSVGETFTIEKIYFQLVTFDSVNNTITNQTVGFTAGAIGLINPLATGEIDIVIANSQVVKQLTSTFARGANFNPTAVNPDDVALGFSTDIVIPPLLEYLVTLKTTSYDLTGNTMTHVQCYLQGTAALLAPQTTF